MPDWVTILVSIFGSAVVATGASLVGVWVYQRQARIDLDKELLQRQHDERRPVYTEFMGLFRDIISNKGKGLPRDAERRMRNFMVDSFLLSSDEVFRRFLVIRRLGDADTDTDEEKAALILTAFADLIRALRADMGYPESSLTNEDILRAFINDFDSSILARDTGTPASSPDKEDRQWMFSS